MSYYSVKSRIDQALKPSSTGKVTVTKTELTSILNEADRDGLTSSEAQLIGTLFSKAYEGKKPASAPVDAFELTSTTRPLVEKYSWDHHFTSGPALDLGNLTPPGPKLSGKTFEVHAGGQLRFEVVQSKTGNVGSLTSPDHPELMRCVAGVKEKRTGDDLSYFSVRIDPAAKKGSVITVRSNPGEYSKRDESWAFEFKIKVV